MHLFDLLTNNFGNQQFIAMDKPKFKAISFLEIAIEILFSIISICKTRTCPSSEGDHVTLQLRLTKSIERPMRSAETPLVPRWYQIGLYKETISGVPTQSLWQNQFYFRFSLGQSEIENGDLQRDD